MRGLGLVLRPPGELVRESPVSFPTGDGRGLAGQALGCGDPTQLEAATVLYSFLSSVLL